jgi:two-component system NtrC family sensor kinase
LIYIMEDVDSLLLESKDGTRRIQEIVQSLRSFSRIDDAGDLKEVNLNDCIESTLKIVWNELKYKCVVHRRLGDLPMLRCNPGHLNQVLMNLLVNAAQAMERQGEVIIETQATPEQVVIRISDTGSGIPPDVLPHIFNPFFTTKPVGQGTGLGLSISYNIIQKHNGTLDVQSSVGQGTTFTISLPLSS